MPHFKITTVGEGHADHAGWRPVLRRLVQYLDRYVEHGPEEGEGDPHDAHALPQIYNENALRGFIAAAIWSAHASNYALEDYVTAGRDDNGEGGGTVRPDLYAHVGDVSYRLEAKRFWYSSWGGFDGASIGTTVSDTAQTAWQQVSAVDEHADWLGAIIFAVPYMPARDTRNADIFVRNIKAACLPSRTGWNGLRLDWYPPAENLGMPEAAEPQFRDPGMSVFLLFKKRRVAR